MTKNLDVSAASIITLNFICAEWNSVETMARLSEKEIDRNSIFYSGMSKDMQGG